MVVSSSEMEAPAALKWPMVEWGTRERGRESKMVQMGKKKGCLAF